MANSQTAPHVPRQEEILRTIHDSIQQSSYAEVDKEQASCFNHANFSAICPFYNFIWKMFGLGYSVSFEEEQGKFIVMNAPENGK